MTRAIVWFQPAYAPTLQLSARLLASELAMRAEHEFRLAMAADVAVELAALVAAQEADAEGQL